MVQDAIEVYAIKERYKKEDEIQKLYDEINGQTYLKYIIPNYITKKKLPLYLQIMKSQVIQAVLEV